ncbi:hypothetical protein ACFYW8_36360 [Streptomyces sp. NPDC002742]|uniref:hypothetical protein n=1 Tax=Streptomyces sp. NPDC002742 TaxID=3364663 RepID=UPI00369F64DA
MGSLLKGVTGVHWKELHGARQSPARDIPPLLSRIAYGGDDTAHMAIDELGDVICSLGFVVGKATAPTVPFLLELVGAPDVPCKAELMDLLESICQAGQWHSAAAASGWKNASFQEQPAWEVAARAAVRAGRPIIEGLASSVRPEEAEAARSLLRTMDEVAPFPEL